MSHNNSFNTPVRTGGNFGNFPLPRGDFAPSYTSSPRECQSGSPDFIPIGASSPGPQTRGRDRWRSRNKSFLSNSSSSGFNSSHGSGYPNMRSSPYSQNTSRGQGRGRNNRGKSRGSNQSSRNISRFYDHSMVEDPWAELETKLRNHSVNCSTDFGSKIRDSESSTDNESSQEMLQESVSQ